METFKKGDTVKIITLGRYVNLCNPRNEGTIEFYDNRMNRVYFEPFMVKYCGHKTKIIAVDEFYGRYFLDIDGGNNAWVYGMFEKIENKPNIGMNFDINDGDTHSRLARQLTEEKYKIKNILSNIASIKYDLTYNTALRPNMADINRRMELDAELENYRKMFNDKQLKISLLKKKIKQLNRTQHN